MFYLHPLEDFNEIHIFHGRGSKRSSIYFDPNNYLFFIEPYAVITNTRKETIGWDGQGQDQSGRAFHFTKNKRDFNAAVRADPIAWILDKDETRFPRQDDTTGAAELDGK